MDGEKGEVPMKYNFPKFVLSFFYILQTLNKNNLLPDDRTNFYPLQQTNVYTTTYYPSTLSKFDFRPDSSPGRTFTNS